MSTTEEEIAREERQRRQQLRQDEELFESLIKHPGWKRYRELLEVVAQTFHQRVMAPITSMDQALPVEFAKGALNAISAAASLPSAKIKEAADLKPDAEN